MSTKLGVVSGRWRKSPRNQRPKIAFRPPDPASLVAQYDKALVFGAVRDINGEGPYSEAEYAREDRVCRGRSVSRARIQRVWCPGDRRCGRCTKGFVLQLLQGEGAPGGRGSGDVLGGRKGRHAGGHERSAA